MATTRAAKEAAEKDVIRPLGADASESIQTTASAKRSNAAGISPKKAVILTGGKQYLVSEGETLEIELLNQEGKTAKFEPLLVIDGDKVSVGAPLVKGGSVTADVVEESVKSDKVTAIRYKPKKRVHKVRGHRQKHAIIKITKIA